MSLILSGTDGLSDVDGTASTPAIRGTDTNTGIFFPAADTIAFAEGGAEVMRINSSGNVGVGTASPNGKLDVAGTIMVSSTDGNSGGIISTSGEATLSNKLVLNGSRGAGGIIFQANSAEAMRIDTSGNLLVGQTSGSQKLAVTGNTRLTGVAGDGALVVTQPSGADRSIFLAGVVGSTNGLTVDWVNGSNLIAARFNNIATTGAGANAHLDAGDGNRLYRSTSSIRYKTNVENIAKENSDSVLNLRPVWYRSLASEDKKDWSWYGLIAEEVAQVEPRLVHWSYLDSDYDVTEENGSIKKTLKENAQLVPDGVQYERVSVLLLDVVKRHEQTIQEQQAIITDLKARLEILEAK